MAVSHAARPRARPVLPSPTTTRRERAVATPTRRPRKVMAPQGRPARGPTRIAQGPPPLVAERQEEMGLTVPDSPAGQLKVPRPQQGQRGRARMRPKEVRPTGARPPRRKKPPKEAPRAITQALPLQQVLALTIRRPPSTIDGRRPRKPKRRRRRHRRPRKRLRPPVERMRGRPLRAHKPPGQVRPRPERPGARPDRKGALEPPLRASALDHRSVKTIQPHLEPPLPHTKARLARAGPLAFQEGPTGGIAEVLGSSLPGPRSCCGPGRARRITHRPPRSIELR